MPVHDQHIRCSFCKAMVVADVTRLEYPNKLQVRKHMAQNGYLCPGTGKIIEVTTTHASSK